MGIRPLDANLGQLPSQMPQSLSKPHPFLQLFSLRVRRDTETRGWASTSSGAFLCKAPGRPHPTGVGWASRRTWASIPKPIIHMVLSKQALYPFPRPQCKHLVLQHLVSTSFSPDLCHFREPPGPAPALWRGQQGQWKQLTWPLTSDSWGLRSSSVSFSC